jgi:hypothetical protein
MPAEPTVEEQGGVDMERWRSPGLLVSCLGALLLRAALPVMGWCEPPGVAPETALEGAAMEVAKRDVDSDTPAVPLPAEDAETLAEALDYLITADREELNTAAVLRFARLGYEYICQHVLDYTCVLIKRERVNGVLQLNRQYLLAKVRHEREVGDQERVPFSVYLRFLGPALRSRGREVLYVRGRHRGDLIATKGGRTNASMTFYLDPTGYQAMDGNRYPVTSIGFKHLIRELVQVLESEPDPATYEVRVYPDAKLNERPCVHIMVKHKERRPEQRYYMARVFVDRELKLPVYFASYDWPTEESSKPRLLEEYAYTKLRLNVGLTDLDFDQANPEYNFKIPEELDAATQESLSAAEDEAAGTAGDEEAPQVPASDAPAKREAVPEKAGQDDSGSP